MEAVEWVEWVEAEALKLVGQILKLILELFPQAPTRACLASKHESQRKVFLLEPVVAFAPLKTARPVVRQA